MAFWRSGISAATYRRITLLALLALIFIIITGGAVRLTGSGLGCSDWPTCEENQFVPDLEYHAMVEFVNRAITGIVSVAVALAVLGALLRRPRRRDLIGLALGLVAGVAGQVVLGGLVVWYHLSPWLVIAHFLLSMVLVANAVVLHHRAGRPAGSGVPDGDALAGGTRTRTAGNLTRLLVVVAVLAIVTGTLLTGAGPHGGDADVERLQYDIPSLARLHGGAMALCAAVALLLWGGAERGSFRLRRRGQRSARHAGAARAVVLVIGAQAAIGYLQYFTGVPPLLVGIHIAGAAALWTAVLRLHLAVHEAPAR
ncbi:MAG: heme A synthase [Acidimicrobiia bacterium]|nr:heme A synthase [Acidimicrobiia bacterium]MYC44134.1 heme A synthase [Acidimicrobiia bacterium]MYI19729.1 heme A synthase [Acidimicrobiia bacterium]